MSNALTEKFDSKTMKFLIINENTTISRITQSILYAEGFKDLKLEKATVNALVLLQSYRPDFIILDDSLPKNDIIFFFESLKKRQVNLSCPIAITLENPSKAAVLEYLKLGIHVIILKPFSSATLLSRIKSMLNFKGVKSLISRVGITLAPKKYLSPQT